MQFVTSLCCSHVMFTAVSILSSCRSLGTKYALFFLLAVTWRLCHLTLKLIIPLTLLFLCNKLYFTYFDDVNKRVVSVQECTVRN